MADVQPVLDMFTNQNPKDHEVSVPFLPLVLAVSLVCLLLHWQVPFLFPSILSYVILFIPSFSFVPLIFSFYVCCFKLFSFQNSLYKENYT